MEPSSRTPEGRPNVCPLCGRKVKISPSHPTSDAPCPHCGHLLWFDLETNAAGSTRQPRDATYQSLVETGRSEVQRRQSDQPMAWRLTLVEFKQQIEQIKRSRSLFRIMKMIPGMRKLA